MSNPDAIAEARRALGWQLAACREAAGLIQEQLAPLIHYGRSAIAHAEIGRRTGSRAFWQRCDQALHAGGALLRGYDEFTALTGQRRAEIAQRREAERVATFRQVQQRSRQDASKAPDQFGTGHTDAWPWIRSPLDRPGPALPTTPSRPCARTGWGAFVHTTVEPPSLVIGNGTTTLVFGPADLADGLAEAAEFAQALIQAASQWESGCRRALAATQPDDASDTDALSPRPAREGWS